MISEKEENDLRREFVKLWEQWSGSEHIWEIVSDKNWEMFKTWLADRGAKLTESKPRE